MVIIEGKKGKLEFIDNKFVKIDWDYNISCIIDCIGTKWNVPINVFRLNVMTNKPILDYIKELDSVFFKKFRRIVIVAKHIRREDINTFMEFEKYLREKFNTKELVITVQNDELDHVRIRNMD